MSFEALREQEFDTFCTFSEVRHLGSLLITNVVSHCISAFLDDY